MILDSLTHVTPDGHWFSTSYDASETRLLKEMDEGGVNKAVVVALAGYIDNDFIAQVCKRHPDRLIPGASINPAAYSTPKQAVAMTKALLSVGQFGILKLHPRWNKYDPLDRRCIAVLEEIAACFPTVKIWLDTLFHYRGGLLKKSPVDTVHELVGRFPSLSFVLLHSCGAEILSLAQAIHDCPNAFLDISFMIHRYRRSSIEMDLRCLFQIFDKRMVFGSDFPEISISEALTDFDAVSLNLATETRSSVLHHNLWRILKL